MFQTSRPHALSWWPRAMCVTEASYAFASPKQDLYHRGVCRIHFFLPPLNRLIPTNMALTMWFFVQLSACLSRHAKPRPSNSQSFLGICSLLQKGLLVYTSDHFILLASGFVWDYSWQLSWDLPWPLRCLSAPPHIYGFVIRDSYSSHQR